MCRSGWPVEQYGGALSSLERPATRRGPAATRRKANVPRNAAKNVALSARCVQDAKFASCPGVAIAAAITFSVGFAWAHPALAAANGPDWLRCPIEELRAAYRRDAVDPGDVAALMVIEQEILTLCAERADAASALLKSNEEIASLREEARARRALEAESPSGAGIRLPAWATSSTSGSEPGTQPAPFSTYFGESETGTPAAGVGEAPGFPIAALSCPEPELPDYAVGSIYGLAGALRAVLWSEEKPYVVSAGAPLPGGLEVDRIDLDSVLVRTGGLAAEVLPWR